jgi:acetate kinase
LTVNGGSSSIKFALYTPGQPPRREMTGSIDRIGLPDGVLKVARAGRDPERSSFTVRHHQQAVGQLIQWLDKEVGFSVIAAIGHRVVHGGPRFSDPQAVTPELMDELRRLCVLDPDHLPGEIALIEGFLRFAPGRPQVVCFDTAFHRDLPRVARLLPIPRRFEAAGIRRYGFHGLSYTYLLEELGRIAGAAADGRVILAHLGAGASLAAVRGGKCIDTTMAFTPTSGLMMGSRTGDLDPGVLLYLLRTERMTVEQIDDLVNRQAGLLGISETSLDMRDLLHREHNDHRAAEAVALFCYLASKWIGALCAALGGGLDTLVFAGGIGENSPEIRGRICQGLGFLGIEMDQAQNAANSPLISTNASHAAVRVIRTDEESVIAKAVYRILAHL